MQIQLESGSPGDSYDEGTIAEGGFAYDPPLDRWLEMVFSGIRSHGYGNVEYLYETSREVDGDLPLAGSMTTIEVRPK